MKVLKFIVFLLFVASFSFGLGFYISYRTRDTKPPIEIIKNVDRPVYKTIYVPQGKAEWDAWEKTPIIIDRNLDKNYVYHIRATDGYKETTVSDKIEVSDNGSWKMTIGVCTAGLVIGAGVALIVR